VPVAKEAVLSLQDSKPCSLWHFRENKIWHPYDEKLSQELEARYYEKNDVITLGDIKFDLKKSMSRKTGASKGKKLLRGTWFYHSDDDINKSVLTWTPYEEDVAKKLELAAEVGFPERVLVSQSPPRYVVLHVGGTFKQYRDTPRGREEGRLVWRGWEGRCIRK